MFDPYHKWLGIKPGRGLRPTISSWVSSPTSRTPRSSRKPPFARPPTALPNRRTRRRLTHVLNEISHTHNVLLDTRQAQRLPTPELAQQSGKIRQATPAGAGAGGTSAFDDLTNANHATVDITRQHHGKRAPKQGAKTMVLLAAAAGALVPIAVALFSSSRPGRPRPRLPSCPTLPWPS